MQVSGSYRLLLTVYSKVQQDCPTFKALTKKDGFCWGSAQASAFEDLKRRLASFPVLALLAFTKILY